MQAELVKTGTSLQLKRVFTVPINTLYRAWTEPEKMNKWFHPNTQLTSVCTVDLQVGGRYEVRMVPPEGDPYIAEGVYREIIPEEKLVFTWRWQGEDNPEMLITLLFREVSDSETELTLIHEQFANEVERDNHLIGWEGTLEQLEAALK